MAGPNQGNTTTITLINLIHRQTSTQQDWTRVIKPSMTPNSKLSIYMRTIRPKSKQDNKTNLNISFPNEKINSQVGFKSTTYCLHVISKKKGICRSSLNSLGKNAVQTGLEPTTHCLRGKCSTTELPWQPNGWTKSRQYKAL